MLVPARPALNAANLPKMLSPAPSPPPPPTLGCRRGWEPRVLWIGIGGSVFFTVLEASKKFYAPKPAAAPAKPCCAGKDAGKKGKKEAAVAGKN